MPIVVVVGGSAGLGRAVARRFADDGWDVGLIARGRDRLDATVREVQSRGRRAISASVVVSDAAGVDAAATEIEHDLGPIDLWVNGPITAVHGEFGYRVQQSREPRAPMRPTNLRPLPPCTRSRSAVSCRTIVGGETTRT